MKKGQFCFPTDHTTKYNLYFIVCGLYNKKQVKIIDDLRISASSSITFHIVI
jgi:hypothetical protein